MTDNDFDWTARLWLEDGLNVMSGHALESALDEIHVTRQRRHWWSAWRTSKMNTPMKVAVGAAAVLLVAVVGINLLPGGSNVGSGGPVASPTPAATPSPTPSPTPIPLPADGQSIGVSKAAAYSVGDPFPIPITVTIPANWVANIGGPNGVFLGPERVGPQMSFTLDQTLRADPCDGVALLEPQPGPTVDDLTTALAALPVLEATTPTDVTIDGYQGKQLTLTAPSDRTACTTPPVDGYKVWRLPLGAELVFAPGQATTFWILDVDGERLVIASEIAAGRPATDQAAAQAVVDSLRIKPAD